MYTTPDLTLPDILRTSARRYANATAFTAPERLPLSYERLYAHVTETMQVLNTLGIGRNDRVAIVVPPAVEAPVAILAIKSAATCITLNPAYSPAEMHALLVRLKLKAIIIPEGLATSAWQSAAELDLHIITLLPLPDQEAGLFRLSSSQPNPAPLAVESDRQSDRRGFAQPDDIVQLVLTSGTQAEPKIIPYIHRKAFAHTHFIGELIGLTPDDRLLSFLPMYHLIGMGYIQQALTFGGMVCYLPGFEVKSFFQSLKDYQPTWFAAVTPMYQAMLDHAPQYMDVLLDLHIRRMVAPSIAVDAAMSAELERVFKAPLIQTYGSTEAAQVSANPMPPLPRKLGSSGIPGAEVATIDENLNFLPPGATGEIVVRGPAVMEGYADDPQATAQAFVQGWYRMGDLGYLDGDGYLFVVGRVKEVINRGGQKVSPAEVEQSLLLHPSVEQAVAFAIPDARLGEEVGAAVVLRSECELSESALRSFAANTLAPYKLPRRIAFVDELPKTALGKVQRTNMAERLGWTTQLPAVPESFTAPRTETERTLARLWSEILGCPLTEISVEARFADLGGTSLNATQLVFKAQAAFKVLVTILDFFDAPTIALQAAVIEQLQADPQAVRQHTDLIPIQPNGSRPPLFCMHAMHGSVYVYGKLIPYLPADQPIYGLQAVGMDGVTPPLDTIDDIVAHQLMEIRRVQTKGPYYLCGYSMGVKIAAEVARRLHDDYGEVAHVFCVDGSFAPRLTQAMRQPPTLSKQVSQKLGTLAYVLFALPVHYKIAYLRQKVRDLLIWIGVVSAQNRQTARRELERLFEPGFLPVHDRVLRACQRADATYRPRPYLSPITYLHATGDLDIAVLRSVYEFARNGLTVIDVPGSHTTVMSEPNITRVGALLAEWLTRLQN